MRLADEISAKKEELLRRAISHKIGRNDWTVDEIKGRGYFLIDASKKETFYMDEEPLIEFYPINSNCKNNILKVSQNYRILYT